MTEVMAMLANTHAMLSLSEANQTFSHAARLADEQGTVVIMKNNAPGID